MAEQIVSPGVFARENDQSFIQPAPVQAGAALVGPTVKGAPYVPTLVTSYSDYQNKFGTTFTSGGQAYTFLTSIAAYNYFNEGGETLLVTRVVSGGFSNFTSADNTTLLNGLGGTIETGADELLNSITQQPSGAVVTYTGISSSAVVSTAGTSVTASVTMATETTVGSITVTGQAGTFQPGDTITFNSESFDVDGGPSLIVTLLNDDIVGTTTNQPFELKTISKGIEQNSFSNTEDANGALESGSKDNVRWEISSRDTGSGTFTLLIRRGNDITNEKTILETWTNLSLDPFAENYVAKVIGDQVQTLNGSGASSYLQMSGSYPNNSSYVYVSAVNRPTPNYFDNSGVAKSQYTASIPIVGSGSFDGASGDILPSGEAGLYYHNISNTDTQGLSGSDYTDALGLLANKDEYVYNVISVPGLFQGFASHVSTLTTLITNTQNRGDAIAVLDPVGYGSSVANAVAEAADRNTSYAAMYWPWCQVADPDLGTNVWVPASTLIPAVYAFNDKVAAPWFAPAGLNRGSLSTVVRAERKLPRTDRDTLYEGKVNPIATFPNSGVVVFGQKTLQTRATALDRVNVRRLLIALKSYISQIANNLVFEQNSIATRNSFLSQVNPYLESVQQRQGVYAFKVVMDDSNNTPDVIDRNQLVGQIFIQPTRTAEFVILDFNILPTGAEFPS